MDLIKFLPIGCFILFAMACETKTTFDLQGHRGCRGLMPENTIPAFLHALDHGVTTLELDLAVSADGQLVVSHEPYMSAEICLDPAGQEMTDSAALSYNLYRMTYDSISQWDCGSKAHPRFPQQRKMKVRKPLLTEVIDTVEMYLKSKGLPPVGYNIELKSMSGYDDVYHPAPAVFSDMVYMVVGSRLDWSRVTIQSFDFRVLQYFHERYPQVTLALLIENERPFQNNLDSLGFRPAIYSCYFELLSQPVIDSLHQMGIRVIPWTVNEPADMQRLVGWGVDGLITDYPDRFRGITD